MKNKKIDHFKFGFSRKHIRITVFRTIFLTKYGKSVLVGISDKCMHWETYSHTFLMLVYKYLIVYDAQSRIVI